MILFKIENIINYRWLIFIIGNELLKYLIYYKFKLNNNQLNIKINYILSMFLLVISTLIKDINYIFNNYEFLILNFYYLIDFVLLIILKPYFLKNIDNK